MKLIILFFLTLLLMRPSHAQSLAEGKRLFELKKNSEAAKIFEAIDDDHRDYAEAQFYLGKIKFFDKKYDDAADYFEEAIDANEKVADYHYWLGAAYGQEASQANPLKQAYLAPKIRAAFEKCVELDPKHTDAMNGLVMYYMRAPSIVGGSPEKAVEMAKKIKGINKLEGNFVLADVYMSQNKKTEAEKELKEAVVADPNTFGTIYRLGSFYIGSQQFQKGIDIFENFLKNNPNNMGAQYQIGKAAALSGLILDRGEALLQNYLKYKPAANEPSLAGAYLRLGMICEKKGNKAEAKKHYQMAVKLEPSLKEAQEALKRIG
jgi:tetratricopeptide (TPR) repeat protein